MEVVIPLILAAVFAAPAAALPPWDPIRWQPPVVHLDEVAVGADGLVLRWRATASGSVQVAVVQGGARLELTLAGFDSHRPRLPELVPPFRRLAWASDGRRLIVEMVEPRPFMASPDDEGFSLRFASAAPPAPADLALSELSTLWTQIGEEERRGLNEILGLARQGATGAALSRLDAMRGRNPQFEATIARVEAMILRSADLPLLAVEPLLRVIELGHPSERDEAIGALVDISARHPLALLLVEDELAKIDEPRDSRLEFERAKLELMRRDAEGAAERLLTVAQARAHMFRARYLVHAAAHLGGDRAAARAHLEHIADHPSAPSSLQTVARQGLARLAYEEGDFEGARARYVALRAIPSVRSNAETELAWLDLRNGQAEQVLAGLLPLDLDRDGPSRALLVATAYLRLCQFRRASLVATGIIENARRTPLARQLDDELARLGHHRFQKARRFLEARGERYRATLSSRHRWSYGAQIRREAHRLRFSADTRQAEEVRAVRFGHTTEVPEVGHYGWRDRLWIDASPPSDHCPKDS